MLTRDRPERLKAAVDCFISQTYRNKTLLIMNSGSRVELPVFSHTVSHDKSMASMKIGAIRNLALAKREWPLVHDDVQIIAHFDDDDWSAPERLAEQVAFMQSSGKSVVGYRDMPIYDEVNDKVLWYDSHMTNYALGTSLMYKREVWERVPFPECTPEDTTWQNQVGRDNIAGSFSLIHGPGEFRGDLEFVHPRMIQVLHGKNAAANDARCAMHPASPELDAAVRKILDK